MKPSQISSQPGTQELSITEQYQHVLKYFNVHKLYDVIKVAELLGYHVFLPDDRVLNLYTKYEAKRFNLVCRLCKQITVKGLVLSFNFYPKMLQDLSFPNFSRLQTLDLSMTGLTSIELLPRVTLQNLKYLSLSGNKITNLKPLRRLRLPQNCTVDLTHNVYFEVIDMFPSSEVELDVKVFNKVHVWKAIVSMKNINHKLLSDYFPI